MRKPASNNEMRGGSPLKGEGPVREIREEKSELLGQTEDIELDERMENKNSIDALVS